MSRQKRSIKENNDKFAEFNLHQHFGLDRQISIIC